jgi:uncharacterized flavoprotein (TIGR03862 family)
LKKRVVIIGGGSSALMLGCELNPEKFDITIYEKNAALGRKFLVAGDGGLNLTHSENSKNFIHRYTPFTFLEKAFCNFTNLDLINWLQDIGITTFVGSSGRVFPVKGIKPVEAFNFFHEKIKKNAVSILSRHEWLGFSKNNHLVFGHNKNLIEIESDYIIFCLGGASWSITGSKGDWLDYFRKKNITARPFEASNCAFKINWGDELIKKIEGKVLKNISITCGNKTHFGEIMLTRFGIEGSGIYPLSPEIRKQLNKKGSAEILIDLKLGVTSEKIIEKLQTIILKKGLTNNLKKLLNLSSVQIQLLKTHLSKEDFMSLSKLAHNIKHFKLAIIDSASVDESISTVGGIALSEIDQNFELKKLRDHFAIGEMLDYDAPTGGYLLQSCFSMANYVAHYLNSKV